jgi:predicted Zn-dependent protease
MVEKISQLGHFTVCLFILSACITSRETGRSSFNFIPESFEASLGESSYRQILEKERQSSNSRWNGILQRIGNRIAQVAERPDFKWEFKLIESKEKNAFCLPGGKVAFYTGIFPVAQTEAGIAVVMGHEVAHATERHGGQRISMSIPVSVGLAGLAAAMGKDNNNKMKQLIFAGLGVGANVGILLPFSRDNESEADEVGLKFMAKAGYDPREGSKFWGRFASEGSSVPTFLSTHPSSASRQAALEAQVNKVWPLYEQSPKYGVGEVL